MQKYDGFPGLRFVSGNIQGRRPAFRTIPFAPDVFIQNLNFYGEKYQAIYCGWVLMPDHYHLLLYLIPKFKLSNYERDLRSMVARQVIDRLTAEQQWGLLQDFKLPGRPAFAREPAYQIWQKEVHVAPVGDLQSARIKLRYLHENPVRAGLVTQPEDWIHSSARWCATGEGPVRRMMKIEDFFARWRGWKGTGTAGAVPE